MSYIHSAVVNTHFTNLFIFITGIKKRSFFMAFNAFILVYFLSILTLYIYVFNICAVLNIIFLNMVLFGSLNPWCVNLISHSCIAAKTSLIFVLLSDLKFIPVQFCLRPVRRTVNLHQRFYNDCIDFSRSISGKRAQ